MLSSVVLEILNSHQLEIGRGLLGLLGGVVRVLWAVGKRENMPVSHMLATLISAAIIPATCGDLMQRWCGLSNGATGFYSFMLGGVAMKMVVKAQDTEVSWTLFSSKGAK